MKANIKSIKKHRHFSEEFKKSIVKGELGIDIKKNSNTPPSRGSVTTKRK